MENLGRAIRWLGYAWLVFWAIAVFSALADSAGLVLFWDLAIYAAGFVTGAAAVAIGRRVERR